MHVDLFPVHELLQLPGSLIHCCLGFVLKRKFHGNTITCLLRTLNLLSENSRNQIQNLDCMFVNVWSYRWTFTDHSSRSHCWSCCWSAADVMTVGRTSTGRAWRTLDGSQRWESRAAGETTSTHASSHCSLSTTSHSHRRTPCFRFITRSCPVTPSHS